MVGLTFGLLGRPRSSYLIKVSMDCLRLLLHACLNRPRLNNLVLIRCLCLGSDLWLGLWLRLIKNQLGLALELCRPKQCRPKLYAVILNFLITRFRLSVSLTL